MLCLGTHCNVMLRFMFQDPPLCSSTVDALSRELQRKGSTAATPRYTLALASPGSKKWGVGGNRQLLV
jgi:hypothetical protein